MEPMKPGAAGQTFADLVEGRRTLRLYVCRQNMITLVINGGRALRMEVPFLLDSEEVDHFCAMLQEAKRVVQDRPALRGRGKVAQSGRKRE